MQTYDISHTYDWNYENAPSGPLDLEIPAYPGEWNFCGLPVASPLGVPAGPLLNSRWILYYASLGFDVLTYKTVRSSGRMCYTPPNLLPIAAPQLTGQSDCVIAKSDPSARSWAISFGMPSKEPKVWQEDVERAKRLLPTEHVLVVSVVATPQEDWTIQQIADDFVRCARWAKESGADAIEANLSCPNVCTQEGQLYTSPAASQFIAASMRDALGRTPLILKIGLFDESDTAAELIAAVCHQATALSTVNSISAFVEEASGNKAFGGLTRGIGGETIRNRSCLEMQRLHDLLQRMNCNLKLIGVGGISTATDVCERIEAGAHHVQIATAAMLDYKVAVKIRQEMSRRASCKEAV